MLGWDVSRFIFVIMLIGIAIFDTFCLSGAWHAPQKPWIHNWNVANGFWTDGDSVIPVIENLDVREDWNNIFCYIAFRSIEIWLQVRFFFFKKKVPSKKPLMFLNLVKLNEILGYHKWLSFLFQWPKGSMEIWLQVRIIYFLKCSK